MRRRGFVCQVGRKAKDPAVPGVPWYVIVDVSKEGERRRQVKASGFRTKAEAQAKLVELLGAVQQGTHVPAVKQTFADYAQDWLAAIATTIRPSTLASYRRNLEQHVVPTLGSMRLQSIDAGTLNALYAQLLTDGRRGHNAGSPLSARTVRYIHTIVHRSLKDATKWKRLARNPAVDADPPAAKVVREAQPTMRTWTAPQLDAFLTDNGDSRYIAPWTLLATTGMRRGEALGLTWDAIDLDAGVVSIRQALVLVGHDVQVGKTKTGKNRQVTLDKRTVSTLRSWQRSRQAQEKLLMGAGYSDGGFAFCHPDGRVYHPERFSREFDRAQTRYRREHPNTALPRIRLHDLRHTWATLALGAGLHPKIVADRLGHSTTAVTMDVYSHVTAGMQSDAAEAVASLIFGPSS